MTNRCTLAQLRDMTPEQADRLPVDQLALLFEDVSAMKADAVTLHDLLNGIVARRYGLRLADLRAATGRDTGRISTVENGCTIRSDLPKKVEWDDDGLAAAEAQLAAMGEPVHEYIRVKRIVSETAFERWPSSLRAIFLPARTVGVGKPTFTVERRAA